MSSVKILFLLRKYLHLRRKIGSKLKGVRLTEVGEIYTEALTEKGSNKGSYLVFDVYSRII